MFNIEIRDPFLLRQLQQEDSPTYTYDEHNFFHFKNQSDFFDHTLSYMISFSLTYTFDSLVNEGICAEDEKMNLFSFLDENKLETIMAGFHQKLELHLEKQTGDLSFDFISFFLCDVPEERKHLKNVFYEAAQKLFSNPHSTPFALPSPSEEIVYFIVKQNGSIQLKDKFSDEIDFFSYNEQEEAVAKTCHLNPENLIVYDHLQLLDPEMVICFKKLLGRKVNFIDSPFPEY